MGFFPALIYSNKGTSIKASFRCPWPGNGSPLMLWWIGHSRSAKKPNIANSANFWKILTSQGRITWANLVGKILKIWFPLLGKIYLLTVLKNPLKRLKLFRSKAITRNSHVKLKNFMVFWLLIVSARIFSMEKMILIQIYGIKSLTPRQAVDCLIGRNASIPC